MPAFLLGLTRRSLPPIGVLSLVCWPCWVQAGAGEALAGAPHELSVTVYRAPSRQSGSIDLDELGGFALVTETRTVHLPAGTSRLRFEGVADGIEPASAIVSGLPDGVIEKNRDARLLSPSALIAAAVGKQLIMRRTNRKTGRSEQLLGTLLSDAGNGVVFQSAQGIEALRCSGLPETFLFDPPADLSARPTLSVLVKSTAQVTREVTLSYLATGFDWAATYTATLGADGNTLDLGAWVTLANGNGTGFPHARTQVVAGRLNRENAEVQPIQLGMPIFAECWPRGSTSDQPPPLQLIEADDIGRFPDAADARRALERVPGIIVAAPAPQLQQEQLGDLKLYRVPERTTVAARQSKQVRLLDRLQIPVRTVYDFEVFSGHSEETARPANRLLRTQNTTANHLGLPLPSGSVGIYTRYQGEALLQHETGLKDLAVDEEVELDMGTSADIEVTVHDADVSVDWGGAKQGPYVPGFVPRAVRTVTSRRVEIANAGPHEIDFELKLALQPGERLINADHDARQKNGRPLFDLKVPAQSSVAVHYRTGGTVNRTR